MLPWRIIVVVAALSGVARAQQTLEAPAGSKVPFALDTGVLANDAAAPRRVFVRDVTVSGAAWIRVRFAKADLAEGSFVVLTSLLDQEYQAIDSASMSSWGFASAYFNGETVRLGVFAGPGATADRVVIEEVEADGFVPRGEPGQCGICGQDDRVTTDEGFEGRLMPAGCSATMVCEDGTAVTAGHCAGTGLVLQFRVPASTSTCGLVNPPVADQFPAVVYRSANGGVGADWAVLGVGVNALGETPFERYRALRRIAEAPVPVGSVASVVGFGRDVTCARNQVQQRSPGAINAVNSTYYAYDCDVRSGNSGSGLIVGDRLVGVVTHCSTACGNIATRVDRADFAAAIREGMVCDAPATLSIEAPAGVAIALDPPDLTGNAGGVGAFTRTYAYGTVVRLAVASAAGGRCFQNWRVNDRDAGPNPSAMARLDRAATTAVACFASSASCCPGDLDDGSGTGTRDESVTVEDLVYFLRAYAAGDLAADLDDDGSIAGQDPDGAVTIEDLLFMLAHFDGAC